MGWTCFLELERDGEVYKMKSLGSNLDDVSSTYRSFSV